jgi:microcystin-dependent protein
MFCDGSLLPISENEMLFQLIGTTYGGDGQETFALPDLRGRVAMHQGNGYIIGESGGMETVSLTQNQIPAHQHGLMFNDGKGESVSPASGFPARNSLGAEQYGAIDNGITADAGAVQANGSGVPHENRQPYLAVNYIISLYGIFPVPSMPVNGGGEEYLFLQQDGIVTQYDNFGNEPFMAEILIFAFNFVPRNWAACNGQLLSINQNQPLFSLLGTTYGGNGQTTFALPDLRGRVPVHYGQGPGLRNWTQGESIGAPTHTLTIQELPEHNHLINASSAAGNVNNPSDNLLASNSAGVPTYSATASAGQGLMTTPTGGSQPHENRQPYLALNYCIAMVGVYPSRDNYNAAGATRGLDPFFAETAIVAFNFAPIGYQSCNGQIMAISQNTALFSLLGTTYGGNGQSTFALPDFRGRVAMQQGQGPGLSNYSLGEEGGEETVSLTVQNLPSHNHFFRVGSAATSDSPEGTSFAPYPGAYTTGSSNVTLNSAALTSAGFGQPHNNIMPTLGLNFIIATQGVFPPRP